SAVARLGCTPSAAYPLSPRRREIFRPPLLDRAGADVKVIRSTIYSGSSVPTNIARKERRQEKGIRRMPPLRVTAIHLWRGFCQAYLPVQEYGAEVCAPIPLFPYATLFRSSQPSPGWGVRLLPHIP